jgi:hypothetical protein
MARQVERLDGSDLPPTKVLTDEIIVDTSSKQHPPLSVLIARKRDHRNVEDGNDHDCHSLKVEEIGDQHVRRINDAWFQQSYQYLFTEAELEDLSYDFFLEDWQAFVALREMNEDSHAVMDGACYLNSLANSTT